MPVFCSGKSGEEVDNRSNAKGFTVLSAASIINKLLGILYVPILTLILGDIGNSIYDAGYKVYQLVFMITNAGIPVAISKMVSEQVASERYDVSYRTLKISGALLFSLGALTSIITAVFARQFSAMTRWPESYLTILALSPTMLFTAVSCIFRGYFQGRSNMVPTGISQILEQAVNSVFTIVFAWIMYHYGVNYTLNKGFTDEAIIKLEAVKFAAAGGTVGTSLGALVGALYLLWIFKRKKAGILKEISQSVQSDQIKYTTQNILKKIFQYAVPITLGSVAIYMTSLIDLNFTRTRLVAGGFSDTEAMALYGILSVKYLKLLFIPVTLATALATTILPSISAAAALGDVALLRRRISKSMKTILMIIIPAAAGMTVMAKPIIYILFPTTPNGWDLLMLGSWSMILISAVSIQTAILQGIGKTYLPTVHMIIGLILKLIVNYNLIAIRSVNVKGAIAGSAVCYIFAFYMNYRSIKRLTGVKFDVKRLFNRPLSVSVIMGLFVYLIYEGLVFMTGWLIKAFFLQNLVCSGTAIVAGMIVYYLLMIIARGITAEDIKNLPKGGRILEYTIRIPIMRKYLVRQ